MNSNNIIKHIFYFPLFFILFYIESISIGGIKFAILWKAPLLLAMLLRLLLTHKIQKLNKSIFLGYLYNLKQIITLSSFSSIVITLSSISKSVVFPLFMQYAQQFYTEKKAVSLIRTLAIYILLSTLPFLLGLIEPLKSGYDLSRYGLDAFGFIGIFQKPHSAAITLAFAIVIVLFFLKFEQKKVFKLFLFLLILIGLYALLKTYVRTGFLLVFIGFYISYMSKKPFLYYVKLFPVLLILIFGLYTYYQNSEVMQMRFEEKTVYRTSNDVTFENFGSGRLLIGYFAITNWLNGGETSILIGLGPELAKEKMKDTLGMRLFAHNGYIEILQTQGLIGIVFFILFMMFLYKYIKKYKKSKYYNLAYTLFILYLFEMLAQGGDIFLIYIFLGLAVAAISRSTYAIGDKKL